MPPQMINRVYESIDSYNVDASILSNSGWMIQNSITRDDRKGSAGWCAFWAVVGLFTIVGFIGCIPTFPRGKVSYNVTYSRAMALAA